LRIASLDMGSNTTLMLVADVENGRLELVQDFSTVTRMGQEIAQTGRLHSEALARLDSCLSEYKSQIDKLNVEKIVAVATSAARDASNKEELLALTDKYEIPIEVISGAEEARITYLGSTFDLPPDESYMVIDIGGGSTEFVFKNGKNQVVGVSLDIGSVRLIDMFVKAHPVPESQATRLREFVQDKLEVEIPPELRNANFDTLVAVAGTPTTLAAIEQKTEFDESKIHGFQLSRGVISSLNKKLLEMSIEQRKTLPGLPEKRADVIVAGAIILEEVLKFFGYQEALVSTKGVRYGLALAKV
jgi:exopolyphosphatase/guanosine-5'-triphosphate,3'-diphosphate pyrophosphatase